MLHLASLVASAVPSQLVNISKDSIVYQVIGIIHAHVGERSTVWQLGWIVHRRGRCALSSFVSQCHRAAYEIVEGGLSAVPRIL